jgi:hypothetical protein
VIAVVASSPAYRAAVGELPLSTFLASPGQDTDAIAVIDGRRGWATRAVEAASRGASALIISDPTPTSGDGDEGRVSALAERLPVILDRLYLRRDVVLDALDGARSSEQSPQLWAFISAGCSAPADRLPDVLADTVGWLRTLAGPVEPVATRGVAGGVITQLRGPKARVSLTVRVLAEAAAGPRVSVTGVAPRRLQVTLASGVPACVRWTDERGDMTLPTRFEGRERLSLGRAVAALTSRELPTDLHDYLADASLTRMLTGHLPT